MKDKSYQNTLKKLLKEFWVAPMDAFIRSYETEIWNKVRFLHPNLDIGCGDGRYDRLLFENKVFDYAIDPDRKQIKIAQKEKLYKKVVLSNAEKMPFKDNHFMQVISNSTFEHIKNDVAAIKEIGRVSKRGGLISFTTTSKYLKDNLLASLKSKEKFNDFNRRFNHFHYRSYFEWKKLLKKCGFKVIKHYSYLSVRDFRIWLVLYNIFTFKIINRELWSYLKDSKYSKYIPSKVVSEIEYFLINLLRDKNIVKNGMWQFIQAKKIQ